MDYSLIVGIEHREFNINKDSAALVGVHAAVVDVFHFGIVDVLQEYNWHKKAERLIKINLRCMDGDGISVMPPEKYGNRFLKRVQEVFDVDESVIVDNYNKFRESLASKNDSDGSLITPVIIEDSPRRSNISLNIRVSTSVDHY